LPPAENTSTRGLTGVTSRSKWNTQSAIVAPPKPWLTAATPGKSRASVVQKRIDELP
jgi:hypothetical protein